MSKSDIKIPVYLSRKSQWLYLMLIVIRNDNSIYFEFPRKKGYFLDMVSEKRFYKGEARMTTRNFIELPKKYENPKISFHPGKMVVHINSGNYRVKKDCKVLNIAPKGLCYCELLQVVFPLCENMYDGYIRKRYHENRLVINAQDDLSLDGGVFSLDIIINSSKIEPNPYGFCTVGREYLASAKFDSGKDLTITIGIFSYNTNEKNSENNIVLNINTLEKNVIYVMGAKA